MGGEKVHQVAPLRVIQGSPPRRRGKALWRYTGFGNARITPAWAGKSDIYETLGTDPEDHPRMGGEN